MADEHTPRNRKERRAAAKEAGTPFVPNPKAPPDIPMALPDRSGPKGKTLYDLAAEREAELRKEATIRQAELDAKRAKESGSMPYPMPSARGDDGRVEEDEELLGRFGHAVVLTFTLALLHFTLDVLVYHQYAQDIEWNAIFKRTFSTLPVLFLLTYILSSPSSTSPSTFSISPKGILTRGGNSTKDKLVHVGRQVLFFGCNVAAGCYMLHVGTRYGYFAVMKRAPPVGTLWVWSVIESELLLGVAGLAITAFYGWYAGVEIF